MLEESVGRREWRETGGFGNGESKMQLCVVVDK